MTEVKKGKLNRMEIQTTSEEFVFFPLTAQLLSVQKLFNRA
jgi:hypothetical protein